MGQTQNWTVLLVGGASGVGKSSITNALGKYYGVNVIKIDDIVMAMEAVTTVETLPMLHYFSTGVNWMKIGTSGNIDWLVSASRAIEPALKAIVADHLLEREPIILEGDFLQPAFAASFAQPKVRTLFVHEADEDVIVQNYLAREGGEEQRFRAQVSTAYGLRLAETCKKYGVPLLEARPWNTAAERAASLLV